MYRCVSCSDEDVNHFFIPGLCARALSSSLQDRRLPEGLLYIVRLSNQQDHAPHGWHEPLVFFQQETGHTRSRSISLSCMSFKFI